MIDYTRVYHTGFLAEDLDAAMAHYGNALGLEWASVAHLRDFAFWTPREGVIRLDLDVTYSITGPQHIEIQRGTAGSFYDPRLNSGFHTGIWSDELPAETERFLQRGWTIAIAGAPPADGYGTFVYLVPPNGTGMMVELVSTAFRPMFEAWLNGDGTLG